MKSKCEDKSKPFLSPTHFDLELRNSDKDILVPVVNWLMERGVHSFSWDYRWDDTISGSIYILCIQSCWAENLFHISKFLGDLRSKDEKNKI